MPHTQSLDPQNQFHAAVVIPTILRPQLRRAVESVFLQSLRGRIHLLIGIDKALGNRDLIPQLIAAAPAHVHITVIDPGYSTSARHGGIYSNHFGGGLKTILSYLANSRFVAYLDDDNWYAPDHLAALLAAIDGHDWAYSLRWYAHPRGDLGLCEDKWESVGPERGYYARTFGGFVDTSSIMLDKAACHMLFPIWSMALSKKGDGEDRMVFKALRENRRPGGATGKPTSYYTLDPNDSMHARREKWIRDAGIGVPSPWPRPTDRLAGR